MYLLPGAMLELALLVAGSEVRLPTPALMGKGGILDSIIFVLVAFILGHFIQALAYVLTERLLKGVFWGGHFPSEVLLFEGSGLVSERDRSAFIEGIEKGKAVDGPTVESWNKRIRFRMFGAILEKADAHALEKGAEAAQSVYDRYRVALVGDELDARVTRSEAYYQFFRGSCTAAWISLVLLWSVWAVDSYRARNLIGAEPPVELELGGLFALALCLIFFWQARVTAQRFAAEVFRCSLAPLTKRR